LNFAKIKICHKAIPEPLIFIYTLHNILGSASGCFPRGVPLNIWHSFLPPAELFAQLIPYSLFN